LAEGAYSETNYGLKNTLEEGGLNTTLGKNPDLPTTAGTIIGAALSFIGVIFLILMIYAGFKWMTAGGNEEETKKAKELIIAAVIGLIIVLSAYAITAYIGGKLGQTTPVAS
jgi:amino acid transporter